MTISLSNHDSIRAPRRGFDEDPFEEDTPDEARLRGLTHQQLADRLTWLAWYQPGVFTAVMDYMDFSDALAADADPTNPGPVDRGSTRHSPRSAGDAALILAYSSSSDWITGTTARAPPSARRRSSTPVTPPSWPGASPARLRPGSDRRTSEPSSAPPTPAGRCGGSSRTCRSMASAAGQAVGSSRPPLARQSETRTSASK